MKRTNHFASTGVFLVLCAVALLGSALIYFAPTFYALEQLNVAPSRLGNVIGYKELGQKPGYFSADQQHLKVRYDTAKQKWYLANVSPNKKVLATLNTGRSLLLKTWYLQVGNIIHVEDHQLHISSLNPLQFTLVSGTDGETSSTKTQTQLSWEGGRLSREGLANFSGCDKAWWKRLLGYDRGFTLGGKVQCVDRLQLQGVPLHSAKIDKDAQGYYLKPLNNQVYIGFQQAGQNKRYQAENIEYNADNMQELILGRTHYQIIQSTGKQAGFSLKPLANFHLFTEPPPANNSAQYTSIWTPQPGWLGAISERIALPGFNAWLILALLLTSVWLASSVIGASRQQLLREQNRGKALFWLIPAALLLWLGVLCLHHLGYQLLCVWLSWAWLSLLMFRQRLFSWQFACLWTVTLAIAGIGLLTQVQLAIGADSTRWLQYPGRHIQFMLFVPLLLIPLLLLPVQALQSLWRFLTTSKLAKALALVGIGLALLIQLLIGDEKGIFGFQPVELTKTVLVFMLSGFAVNWFHLRQVNALTSRENLGKQLAFFGWVLLLAVVVYIVVLGGVRDFSPILIIGGLLLAFLWVVIKPPHLPASALTWVIRGGVLISLAAIIGLGLYILDDPVRAAWLDWVPQSERIALWADPWRYPDAGRQLQLALEAVHGGIKEATTAHWLGGQWMGLNSSGILNIPAIQDDFILAFYLNRWGGGAGLLLLFLQISWVFLLFSLSQQLLSHAEQRNRDQRLSYRFLAYVVYGMAWMHILHWLISWGNTLGVLPIMGQPMTWLSSGMSHLLAIALPSLLLMILASRFLQKEY